MAKDPYRYFRIEARELVDQLGQGMLALERDGGAQAVPHLLRLAHTLKGAARVVKQAEIADLIHGVEDALAPYRSGADPLPRERIDLILAKCDAINARLAELPRADGAAPDAAPLPAGGEGAPRIVRADVIEVDALLEGLAEIGSELALLARGVAQLDSMRELAQSLQDSAFHAQDKGAESARQLETMAITLERSMAAGAERIDRELRETRDAAERLRLIPVSSIFHALERTARDAAYAMGKLVVFESAGGHLRIDGEVLDVVQGAMVQLVRNAVAHGIEAPARRRAAGKGESGRITVDAVRRGHRVWLRCSDDGAGIDLGAVRRVLGERGAASDELAALGSAQLLDMLLRGGITTSGQVSELAGRGIGLDVVRAAMHDLGGEVRASTDSGQGTAIELRVPLRLAALDVLLVEADSHVMALPLDAVKGTLRVRGDDIIVTPEGESIAYLGRSVRLLELKLGARVRGAHRWAPRALTAVILEVDGALTALAVSRLRGIESIVLRALPELAPADPMILGLHLDSEGSPRMVLDPEALAASMRPRGAGATPAAPAKPILIVDDSLTTRMLESSILESAGYSVAMAASGEEGLEMARRKSYALFLVDVEMPGMNGFEFIESTRADALLRHVPSILVTSCDAPEYRQRGAAAGAAAYIVKNEFDQADFLLRVGELVPR